MSLLKGRNQSWQSLEEGARKQGLEWHQLLTRSLSFKNTGISIFLVSNCWSLWSAPAHFYLCSYLALQAFVLVSSLSNQPCSCSLWFHLCGWLVVLCAWMCVSVCKDLDKYFRLHSEQINNPLSCLPSIKWLIERSIKRLVEGVKVWVVARVSRHVLPQPVGMVWVAAVLMSWGVVLVLHWVVDVTCVVAVFWHTRLKMTTILFHYTTYRELSMWNVLQSQQIQTPSYKIKHNVLQTKCLRTSALFLIRGTWFQQNYKI